MTATANTAFTAAQFNTHVRDNLNETAAAKATTAGRIFVATGANTLAERAIESASIATNESVSSTSYADATTPGPSVTLTTGTKALVILSAQLHNGTADAANFASVAVSGATTTAASDTNAYRSHSATTFDAGRASTAAHLTLTAGSNTFKMQYRCDAGTVQAQLRHIVVIGL